jgi:hypothetical protein
MALIAILRCFLSLEEAQIDYVSAGFLCLAYAYIPLRLNVVFFV